MIAEVADLFDAFRPGGGESYSGGGGHGGSGGSGGDGGAIIEIVIHLIRLIIYWPEVGIPVTVLFFGILIYHSYKKQQTKDWDSGPPIQLKKAVSLDRLRQVDPDFSPILFEDFCFRLYATCHEARHDDALLEQLAPYVAESARAQLKARQPRAPVTGVVIGAMRPYFVTTPSSPDEPGGVSVVGLELETNYSVDGRTTYAIERWRLTRAASARTRKRDLAKGFPCPNCGAPWEASATHGTQQCRYCGEVVDNGRFDWLVVDIELAHSKDKPPTLTQEVPERGTDLPTYTAPDANANIAALFASDPSLDQAALMARVQLIFTRLYAAWDANDLRPVRMFLSDGLYDYLTYWTEAYEKQGLRNRLQDMRITGNALAKVTRDRWYDAITLRIWGTGKDWVVKKSGEHVRGSKSRDRAYSEYWTLIRSAERRGPTIATGACSNCGAPANAGMTGACEHCGAHVTSGEFDWVLSKIEQDDSYRG